MNNLFIFGLGFGFNQRRCFAATKASDFIVRCRNYKFHGHRLFCFIHFLFSIEHPEEFILHPSVFQARLPVLENPIPEPPVPAPVEAPPTPPATPPSQDEDQDVTRALERPDAVPEPPVPAPIEAPPTLPATPPRQAEDPEVGARAPEPAVPEPAVPEPDEEGDDILEPLL
ncbi:uncharacterized protein BJ171DRAFT_199624 [Polychytrium aggregatum]|uniref:uncharacterized protein n=1 Tax=Polychytrium aggregatum TaxID=110093 RepID=UPI0022FE3589|nr:uncharacterized protein BJ171DRAFT_199624 [Polychytrium aggregatum]KAI9199881.1 hypothetical protein BJ171DRAFT_199624 [Polychytrium aggregatum]